MFTAIPIQIVLKHSKGFFGSIKDSINDKKICLVIPEEMNNVVTSYLNQFEDDVLHFNISNSHLKSYLKMDEEYELSFGNKTFERVLKKKLIDYLYSKVRSFVGKVVFVVHNLEDAHKLFKKDKVFVCVPNSVYKSANKCSYNEVFYHQITDVNKKNKIDFANGDDLLSKLNDKLKME